MMDLGRPEPVNHSGDQVELSIIGQETWIHRSGLRHDPEAKAGRTSAIGHRLANIDDLDLPDRAVAADMPLNPSPNRSYFHGLSWNNQCYDAVRRSHQLSVEQIGGNSVFERHVFR